MTRLTQLLITGLLTLTVSFIVGCGDDDDVTGTGGQTQLTPEDSSLITEMLTDDIMTTSLEALGISWELVDYIPGSGASKFAGTPLALSSDDEETIIIDAGYVGFSDGWHIFNFTAQIVEYYDYTPNFYDTTFVTGWDSIQVIADGEPIQYPTDQTVVEMLREHVHITFNDNNDGSGSINHLLDVGWTYVLEDTILTIDGTTDDEFESSEEEESGACDISLSVEQTITNLVFTMNIEGDCPDTGSIVSSSTINAECTDSGGPVGMTTSGTWTVNTTINIGSDLMTITFATGGNSWTVTESCDQPTNLGAPVWRE